MPSTVEELGPGPPTFLCDPKTPVSVTQLSDFDPTFLSLIPFRKVVITNVLTTSLVDLFPPNFFFQKEFSQVGGYQSGSFRSRGSRCIFIKFFA